MDLQSLQLRLTDADLHALASNFIPPESPVKDVRIAFLEGVVQISGSYPTSLFNIPFQTIWEPFIRSGKVCVRLAEIKVVGLPVGMLRGKLLSGIREAIRNRAGASIEEDTVVLDLDRILSAEGIPLTTHLKSIRCTPGEMLIVG